MMEKRSNKQHLDRLTGHRFHSILSGFRKWNKESHSRQSVSGILSGPGGGESYVRNALKVGIRVNPRLHSVRTLPVGFR